MKQRDFADWLADVLREYDGPVDDLDEVDVIDAVPMAVGVMMRDGSRFVLEIEAIDE